MERETVLQQLRNQCDDPGPARATHCAMSWDRARDMAACELVELGAHTVNHPWLSALSLADQRREILDSKRVLEEQIGRSVTSFAYPYGTRDSYTVETVALLREARFTNACSNFRARIGGNTDPFQIPRLVVRDWDGEEFLQQLKAGQR
jgi:peptidoglycan/xylan/chitin deacetylase (PgdA/CDA1 family)